MKWKLKKKLYFTLFLLMIMMVSAFTEKYVQASSSNSVNATVRISVCGNEIDEDEEECDNDDLDSKQCANLGFSGGNLDCDISCSFDVSSCVAPTINPDNVEPNEVSSLLAAGYFSKSSLDNITSVSSLTAATQITINIPISDGIGSIVVPENVIIARSDGANFDPTTLTSSSVDTSSLSGFSSNLTIDGALQWGISEASLDFSEPVTLNIFAGTSLNGQTLNVVRSTSTSSGWTSDGIVSPATCTISEGLCGFQATKASYFATTRTVAATPTPTSTLTPTATPTPTPTTATSSSESSGASSTTTSATSTPTPAAITSSLPIIPDALKFYMDYLNSNGRIKAGDLFNAVKSWVIDWKEVLTDQLVVNNGEAIPTKGRRCDVNRDSRCDIKDLSVLLFYVEK